MKSLGIKSFWVAALVAVARAQEPSALAAEGRFPEAAKAYVARAESAKDPTDKLKATLNAASCMKVSGDLTAATRLLAESAGLLDVVAGEPVRALFLSEYGSVLALGRKPLLAVPVLERAAVLAGKLGDNPLLAEIRNDLGIAFAGAGRPEEAFASYESAMEISFKGGMNDLLARARQNRLLAAFAVWRRDRDQLARTLETNPGMASDAALVKSRRSFEKCLAESARTSSGTNNDPTHLFERVSAGIAAVRYGEEEQGYRLLEAALENARTTGQNDVERAALLALAELYIDHERRTDAALLLDHLRRGRPEDNPLQLAGLEILKARCEMLPGGNRKQALSHADRAARAIEDLRGDIAVSQSVSDLGRPFREWAGLPYLIKADLETRDGSPAALLRAQQAIEAYKRWELDDFYRDDCVNLALGRATDLSGSIPAETAVVYVIPLPDRTEILVGTSGGTRKWTSPVPSETLESKVRLLRHQLEYERGIPSHIATSEFLHDAVIAPCLGHLRKCGVRHIVFVPEGAFASVPPAALRSPESNRYLIEEFSISVSPGLSLLPNDESASGPSSVLLAGVSEGVQGFAPLPGVVPELAEIARIRGSVSSLLDSAFTADSLARGLIENQATTIHLASHAEFSGDPDETFLLTHDGRITMNDLERMIRPRKFTGQPVGLLCLSACRTAAGDDKAALGLAGAAIKSGARSVVASLWYVDDTASSSLMVAFHRNSSTGAMNKSEALRKAQLDMIRSGPYIHPYLWAPFILIGDWK